MSARKLRRESLPIANGARESCAASLRGVFGSMLIEDVRCSSRDVCLDVAALDDRQDARETETDGASPRVRLGPELEGATAEELRAGGELHVHFKSDHGLEAFEELGRHQRHGSGGHLSIMQRPTRQTGIGRARWKSGNDALLISLREIHAGTATNPDPSIEGIVWAKACDRGRSATAFRAEPTHECGSSPSLLCRAPWSALSQSQSKVATACPNCGRARPRKEQLQGLEMRGRQPIGPAK